MTTTASQPTTSHAAPAPEKTYRGYALRLYLGGWYGHHHYYVGNTGQGLVYSFTLGKAMVGWVADMIGSRRKFNQEMAAQGVLSSRTRG